MQNRIHNRRGVVGVRLAVSVLLAVAVVLLFCIQVAATAAEAFTKRSAQRGGLGASRSSHRTESGPAR